MHIITKYRIHLSLIILAILCGVAVWLLEPHFEKKFSPNAMNEDISAGLQKEIIENFAAHKALYEIKLSSTRSGSQIANISGEMYYEWKSSCDGWLSDHRFNMLYEYADSPSMRITSNFSTHEYLDGSRLDFSSQRKNNGTLFENIRGYAEKGLATYTEPLGLSYELPADTMFPVYHTAAVLRQIRSGNKFFTTTIFDGSDTEGPIEASSFLIGDADITGLYEENKAIDQALLKSAAHNVRLAFFALNETQEQQSSSDYEMDLVFHENGIISKMSIDYDDFSITQNLIALEKIETPCAEAPVEQVTYEN